MENKATELVFILDKSGSMSGMEQDTIGGFNAMIEKQKKQEGVAYVSTFLFSNHTTTLHDRKPLSEIQPLTEKDYQVGGCTALLDAIGIAIAHISTIHKYARTEDVPQNTMFVITTDGMENASIQYASEQIKALIREKEALGWNFLFVAANIDAVSTAESIGIQKEHAANYCVAEDTEAVYQEVCESISSFRECGTLASDWGAQLEKRLKRRK